ncbi:hypothetical protein F5Y17DRAFT_471768 [Xylariaceae sp. FL0594]|nr:hypothetical protein F5Y17DRAFT_471768 [Xylariaceae sp. FL0594]
MSFGSGQSGPHRQDWATVEAEYWQNTQKTRDREDAKLAHEYKARHDELDRSLIGLHEERCRLLEAIKNLDATIDYHVEEKRRISREYEARQAQLLAERREEDSSQQAWFARTRDSSMAGKDDASHADTRGKGLSNGMSTPAVAAPASGSGWTTVNNSALRRSSRVQDQRRDHGDLFGNIFHNPVEEVALPRLRMAPEEHQTHQFPNTSAQAKDGAVPEPLKQFEERVALKVKSEPLSLPPISSIKELSPTDGRRSSRGRKSLPSIADSASRTDSPAPEPTFMVDQEKEITLKSLVLKDNGQVIVEPPMYAGVPLEKITPKHAFWNPEWEPLEPIIQASLDKWKTKLEKLRQDPNAVRHSVFLSNRQVNRGLAIIEFLHKGPFHPLQFVSRELMDKYHKTFISYDTIFRLVNVHEELSKFELEVTPLQWLRQRMYEISEEKGDKFNLSRTIHELYHDEKLKYQREKHGFGNIGRPSGYKLGSKGKSKGATAAKSKRKKEPTEGPAEVEEGLRPTPTRRSSALEDHSRRDDYLSPISPRLPKRQRLDGGATRVELEEPRELETNDLDVEGYSSQDSSTGGRIAQLDFRVLQVKVGSRSTTRAEDTQYLTYKPEENMFEHQVFRDGVHIRPTAWESYGGQQQKLNWRLDQVQEIRYAPGSLKIVVSTTNREQRDILVAFKRERTKKRFLDFVNRKGTMLLKTSQAGLEEAWDAIASRDNV